MKIRLSSSHLRRTASFMLAAIMFAAVFIGQPAASLAAQAAKPMTIGIPGDIRSLDPYGSNLEVWVVIRNQIFDSLVKQDPAKGVFLPGLATDYKFADPLTLNFTLRDGVKFHNGAPFTAADVKFSIDRATTKATGGEWVGNLAAIDSVVVNSPTSVTIKFKQASGSVLYYLSGLPILSAGDGDKVATAPNGTGSFKFSKWEQNNQIVLERNPDAWRKTTGNASTLVFKIIPNEETRIASLLAGDIDFLFNLSLKNIPRLKAEKAVTTGVTPPSDSYWIAYLNLRRPPFDNLKVRQAVLTAFDRKTFGDAFTAGNSRPSNSPLAPENPYYNADVDKLYAFDMKAAAKLLADAGFPGGKGLKFEIIYPTGYDDMKAGSEMIQAAMTELGADVKVTELELANWSNRIVKTYDYDISWDIRSNGLSDPAVPFGEAAFYTPSESNFDGFKVGAQPRYEELLKQGITESDPAKRTAVYKELQQIWADNLPGYVIARRSIAHAYSNKVSGVEIPLINGLLDFAPAALS